MSAGSSRAAVLVLGGGLAGSAAAIQLARAGVAVTLLERERTTQHKVCGEFLSGEALGYLQQLGVDLPALGAVPLHTVRVAKQKGFTESALPFAAMSLTRRRLDAHLLSLAEQAGVDVRRGCMVEALERDGNGWRASLADGLQLQSSDVFLATGKHDLRGHPRGRGSQRGLVAFKMYWRLSPDQQRALGNAVELVTYRSGYAGLQPVEAGCANLCCLVQGRVLQQLGKGWPALLEHMLQQSPHLRTRLADAVPLLDKPLTIASLPYGFVRPRSGGIWYLGDQAAVIPSFTGDGMSLALHTGMLAARHFLQGWSADTYQQTFARQVARQVYIATAVSRTLIHMPRASLFLPQLWPGALKWIARQTRIDPSTLLKTWPER